MSIAVHVQDLDQVRTRNLPNKIGIQRIISDDQSVCIDQVYDKKAPLRGLGVLITMGRYQRRSVGRAEDEVNCNAYLWKSVLADY